jgi:hypothetical protein
MNMLIHQVGPAAKIIATTCAAPTTTTETSAAAAFSRALASCGAPACPSRAGSQRRTCLPVARPLSAAHLPARRTPTLSGTPARPSRARFLSCACLLVAGRFPVAQLALVARPVVVSHLRRRELGT